MDCSFVADAMLGTLAKWLRILGYDTHFDPTLDDHQLVRLARAQNRVLLTRDRELARRRGLRALLVASEHLDEQIRQVVRELGLEPLRAWSDGLSRCPLCNEPLLLTDREVAQARLPAYVARSHDQFKQCPTCQRIYWRGTHWQRMDQFVDSLCERSNGG